jgi:hypothetical protein
MFCWDQTPASRTHAPFAKGEPTSAWLDVKAAVKTGQISRKTSESDPAMFIESHKRWMSERIVGVDDTLIKLRQNWSFNPGKDCS